jgi:hypothetical protein
MLTVKHLATERCREGVEGVEVLAWHAGGGAGQSVTHPPFWVAGTARGGSLLSGAGLDDHTVGHLREVGVVDDQHRVGQDLPHAALNTAHVDRYRLNLLTPGWWAGARAVLQ